MHPISSFSVKYLHAISFATKSLIASFLLASLIILCSIKEISTLYTMLKNVPEQLCKGLGNFIVDFCCGEDPPAAPKKPSKTKSESSS
ncbi:MAG: hypothetical protein KAH32_02050 [Chlamydiia bacterium]|nr:hypothetical protein [Chlamydiia bacterium]